MSRLPACLFAAAVLAFVAADKDVLHPANQAAKDRLAPLQSLVGGWKGVGQPQRGSTKNNWTEQAEWAWDFSGAEPALAAKITDGKYFTALSVTADKDGAFRLAARSSAANEPILFHGKPADEGRWIFTADKPQADQPARITFRTVAAGDRLLVLYEKPGADAESWKRLAEVGATRIGSGFGQGGGGRECVVTGGLGTIAVTHEGKTYYVCCTGCRDLFNERPAEVLAEYKAKKDAEAKKKAP